MKPIGGIVTNSSTISENFRQLEYFTSDVLKQLWKVFSVNRDVLDKGWRLENLFWRIWRSELSGKPYSGRHIARIVEKMLMEDDATLFKSWKKAAVDANIKLMEKRRQPIAPLDSIATPRPSLEIECPPTPPPSPIPDSIQRGFATESYLSKLPPHTAITACLQQAFPPPPPSPPPVVGRQSEPILPSPALAVPETLIEEEEEEDEEEIEKERMPRRSRMNPQQRPGPTPVAASDSRTSDTLTPGSFQSQDSKSSKSSKGSKNSGGLVQSATRAEQLRRGRRKKGGFAAPSKANRTRGIRPPPVNRKSTSSSNTTTATTTTTTPTTTTPTTTETNATTEAPQSLPPDARRKPPKRQDSVLSEPDQSQSKNLGGSGWVVDPDFRTKYIEQKKKEGLALTKSALRAPPTTAVTDNVATAQPSRNNSNGSSNRRISRRKNVLVVDELVPLKGLDEEQEAEDGGSSGSRSRTSVDIEPVQASGEFVNLPRQKSELSMLFESAKKKDKAKAAATSSSKGKERRR